MFVKWIKAEYTRYKNKKDSKRVQKNLDKKLIKRGRG